MTVAQIALAYHQFFLSSSDDDFWAWEAVAALCEKADTGEAICIAAAESCTSNVEVATVAAGPFETVLKRFGPDVIKSFRSAAMKSERVRMALSGVWLRDDDPVFAEWKQLMIDLGFWNHKPMSPLDRGWEPPTKEKE